MISFEYNKTPIDLCEARDWDLQNDKQIKRTIQELLKVNVLILYIYIPT